MHVCATLRRYLRETPEKSLISDHRQAFGNRKKPETGAREKRLQNRTFPDKTGHFSPMRKDLRCPAVLIELDMFGQRMLKGESGLARQKRPILSHSVPFCPISDPLTVSENRKKPETAWSAGGSPASDGRDSLCTVRFNVRAMVAHSQDHDEAENWDGGPRPSLRASRPRSMRPDRTGHFSPIPKDLRCPPARLIWDSTGHFRAPLVGYPPGLRGGAGRGVKTGKKRKRHAHDTPPVLSHAACKRRDDKHLR
jgi:hypothetical protein